MNNYEINLEIVTDDEFQPFGQLLSEKISMPNFTGDRMESWSLNFECDGNVELMFNRFHYKNFEFSKLERHFHVTQTFLPLGGKAMVMIVSKSTDPQDSSIIPKVEDIRAFYINGYTGVMLWKGTWHALHRFPVGQPYVDVGLITEKETQKELEDELMFSKSPKRTAVVDYVENANTNFKIVDPQNLISG